MIVAAFDPGATTGWCAYDATTQRVTARGQFHRHEIPLDAIEAARNSAHVVIEGFGEVHAGIYPQTVAAAVTCGRLIERLIHEAHREPVELTRLDVKRALTAATLREPVVTDDRSAWRALLVLHGGDDAAKKGGPLHAVKAHERAALAVAVAFVLRTQAHEARA